MESLAVDMLFDNEWMEYSEALDKADRIWQEAWGTDVEDVYLEEMGDEL